MPRCEGRATGPGQVQPCPDNRNDASVRSRQGDLFLCDACTEFRFPPTGFRSRTVVPSTSTYQLRPAVANRPTRSAKTKKGNSAQSTDISDISTYDVSSEQLCCQCQGSGELRCNICLLYFDHECANLSLDTYKTLLSIVLKTGWVCLNCRNTSKDKISELQTVQAALTEQLSDAMVSLAYLHDELDRLKCKPSSALEPNDTEQAMDKVPVTTTVVEATVLNTLDDLKRRQQNVIITGLAEPADTDEADSDYDEKLFTELCEQHLHVKPLPLRGFSRRLGKKNVNDARPRRLLIKLKSEDEVQSVLAAAKTLRHSDDCLLYTSPSPRDS